MILPSAFTDHLLCYHNHSFRRESAVAVIKEVFEGWTKEVDDKYIMEAFLAKVIDIRYTS